MSIPGCYWGDRSFTNREEGEENTRAMTGPHLHRGQLSYSSLSQWGEFTGGKDCGRRYASQGAGSTERATAVRTVDRC